MRYYTTVLDPTLQVDTEESIASRIYARGEDVGDRLTEEDCADLGRDILEHVLAVFRPDLLWSVNSGVPETP